MPFVERNVAADRGAAYKMIEVSGQNGVPVITVDEQVVIGFNQPRLMELIRRARPRLGAAVADAALQKAQHSGIPAQGAYVGRVRPGSAAERAGLRRGDVITRLGGQSVAGADDVHRLVADLPTGHDVSLTYVRQGREHDILIRL